MAWEGRGGRGGGEMRERKGGQEQAVQKGQAAGGIPGDLVQKAEQSEAERHWTWVLDTKLECTQHPRGRGMHVNGIPLLEAFRFSVPHEFSLCSTGTKEVFLLTYSFL